MRTSERPAGRKYLVTTGLVLTMAMAGCGGQTGADAAQAALARGLEAHRAGRTAEAIDAYREVLRLDPKNKFAYFNLGVAEQAAGRPAGAEALYRLALSLDPNFVPALLNLAIVRTEADDPTEAKNLYLRLIDLEPRNAEFHMNLGFLLLEEGEEDEGNREIRTALRLDPALRDRISNDQRSDDE